MPRATRPVRILALLTVLLTVLPLVAAPAHGQRGPDRGSLVIVGGAMSDPVILGRFMQLAGGEHASIVVIPTAGGAPDYDASWGGMAAFRQAGAAQLTLLHAYDPAVADSDGFAAPIQQASGVWFTGGRQWRLADAYLGTQVETELRALLDRGGVIGGSSAGATMVPYYMGTMPPWTAGAMPGAIRTRASTTR